MKTGGSLHMWWHKLGLFKELKTVRVFHFFPLFQPEPRLSLSSSLYVTFNVVKRQQVAGEEKSSY